MDDEEYDRLVLLENQASSETAENHLRKVWYIVPLLGALIYLGYQFYQNQSLSSDFRVTSAVVLDVEHTVNWPYFWIPETKISYKYLVNGVDYEAEIEWKGDYAEYSYLIGESKLLLFSPKSPNNSELLLNSSISSKLIFPANGVSEDSLKIYVKDFKK